MTLSRLLLTATTLAVLSACAAERKPPPPAPAPAPRPAERPAPPAPPPPADWRDAPATPGDWVYRAEGGTTMALFGPAAAGALLIVRCEAGKAAVTIERAGKASGPLPLTVTTTSATRSFTASPADTGTPVLQVRLSPRDPVLDAMAFSRGRFMVEAPGLQTLYLPAWPEVGRVIEDCR